MGERNLGANGEEARLERFVQTYVSRYREVIENESLPEGFLPLFYSMYPYKVQVYRFENGTFGMVFLKGGEGLSVSIRDGEFHEVRWILEDKACERFLALKTANEGTAEMAHLLAEKHGEHDVSFAKKRQTLKEMRSEIDGLEEDITEMVKVNPWLEERGADQMSRLSTTKTMIETLDTEVGEEKYVLFKEYLSQLDLLELHLPPSFAMEEGEEEFGGIADDDVPTLATIATENMLGAGEEPEPEPVEEEEEEEEEPPPHRRPARVQRDKGEKKRPLFVEVKKERLDPKMERIPVTDLPPEMKKTIFRMNRRLYNLEKKVEPLTQFKTTEIKQIRGDTLKLKNDTQTLHKQLRQNVVAQGKRIDASSEALTAMLADEAKKIRKFAIGLGLGAVIVSLIALMLVLYNMGYLGV